MALTVLVLSNPALRTLRMLDRLPADTHIVAGENAEIFRSAAPEAEIVVTGGTYRDLLSELWPRLKRVRWVHSLAAGLETLLFPELAASPVLLTNSKGVFARSLGEFAIAGMLYFSKDLRRMRLNQRAGVWEPYDVGELFGQTLGIVGYGAIGKAAARLAKAFGMKVGALRRSGGTDPLVDVMYTHGRLDELLRESDFLLIGAPLTAETRGLIGAAELEQMKPTAVLINLGRGPVVVEAALVEALTGGRIRGAVLDVFDEEPLPAGHPFYSLDNVLLSPHCADHTRTWLEDQMQMFLDNFERFTQGQPLMNIVDKQKGY
ncbi:MAG: D-2-hydroxyacid dehydrogenase [Bryobacterales bacterium]|nr:D-2-hydroxyacid dehydrogenase [Bryobacterales bacterium]